MSKSKSDGTIGGLQYEEDLYRTPSVEAIQMHLPPVLRSFLANTGARVWMPDHRYKVTEPPPSE